MSYPGEPATRATPLFSVAPSAADRRQGDRYARDSGTAETSQCESAQDVRLARALQTHGPCLPSRRRFPLRPNPPITWDEFLGLFSPAYMDRRCTRAALRVQPTPAKFRFGSPLRPGPAVRGRPSRILLRRGSYWFCPAIHAHGRILSGPSSGAKRKDGDDAIVLRTRHGREPGVCADQ
jgi:integrase